MLNGKDYIPRGKESWIYQAPLGCGLPAAGVFRQTFISREARIVRERYRGCFSFPVDKVSYLVICHVRLDVIVLAHR